MMKIQTVQLSRERTGELLTIFAGLKEINFANYTLDDVQGVLVGLTVLTKAVEKVSSDIGADLDELSNLELLEFLAAGSLKSLEDKKLDASVGTVQGDTLDLTALTQTVRDVGATIDVDLGELKDARSLNLSVKRTEELLQVLAGIREIDFGGAALVDAHDTLVGLIALTETVKGISKAIGVDQDKLKNTLYRSTRIARRDPEVLKERFIQNILALDVSEELYRKIVIKDPARLGVRPEKLKLIGAVLREFNTKGVLKHPVEDYMVACPRILTWQVENFKLRLALAERTSMQGVEGFDLLHRPRWEIEKELVGCFNHGAGNKVIGPDETDLLALYERGLFKSYGPAEPSELVVGG